jgi:hypothetical protein
LLNPILEITVAIIYAILNLNQNEIFLRDGFFNAESFYAVSDLMEKILGIWLQ